MSAGTNISHRPFVMCSTGYQSRYMQDCNKAFSRVRGTCPAYFSDVCTPVQTVVGRAKLHSAHHGHLIVPATKTKTFGNRSFRYAAHTVWNSLPSNFLDTKKSRGQWTQILVVWMCLHVVGATENIIVAAPDKCSDCLCVGTSLFIYSVFYLKLVLAQCVIYI